MSASTTDVDVLFDRSRPELGIDEKAVRKGQDYESLVYDLDRGTAEAVVEERTQASLESYYRQFTGAAGSLNLDLVRDNRMPGRGGSA